MFRLELVLKNRNDKCRNIFVVRIFACVVEKFEYLSFRIRAITQTALNCWIAQSAENKVNQQEIDTIGWINGRGIVCRSDRAVYD